MRIRNPKKRTGNEGGGWEGTVKAKGRKRKDTKVTKGSESLFVKRKNLMK